MSNYSWNEFQFNMPKPSIEDDLIAEIKRLESENAALKSKIQVLRDLLLDR